MLIKYVGDKIFLGFFVMRKYLIIIKCFILIEKKFDIFKILNSKDIKILYRLKYFFIQYICYLGILIIRFCIKLMNIVFKFVVNVINILVEYI